MKSSRVLSTTSRSPVKVADSNKPQREVVVEKKGDVWFVILNRPERKNAVDGPTAKLLFESFKEFDADDSAKVAILYGNKSFCAGADLKQLAYGEGFNPLNSDLTAVAPMGPTRLLLNKPVIAAIEGYAVAGGFELALWADLRVAGESSRLGCLERRWGVPLIDGGTVRLPRLIGMSRALDLILTGREISAEEAFQMGIVNRLVKDHLVKEEAENLARLIASYPQECMRSDRLSCYNQQGKSLEEALSFEFQIGQSAIEKEGVQGKYVYLRYRHRSRYDRDRCFNNEQRI